MPDESAENHPGLSKRRGALTDELLARRITGFTLFEPQWWSTCCEPSVISQPRNAGGARLQVQVLDEQGMPWIYVFDVFTDGPYFGDALGNPFRHWTLRDVYPLEGQPLYWRLVYTGEVRQP